MTQPAAQAADESPASVPGSAVSGHPLDSPLDASGRVYRLVHDLMGVGLTEVDAHRAAFCALALADGWSKARIGRYLGISRARVGQKVEKLQDYAASAPCVPTLRRVMRVAESAPPWRGLDSMVEFNIEDWDDLTFARRVCEIPGR